MDWSGKFTSVFMVKKKYPDIFVHGRGSDPFRTDILFVWSFEQHLKNADPNMKTMLKLSELICTVKA